MNYNGAIEDTRIDELQKLDWKHEELFGMSSPVEWKEVSKIPKYTIRNQDGSGACGAFSACVALGRNEEFDNGKYVNLSPAFIYNLRVDKTREGMAMFNLFDIMKNYGSILDEALSSDNLSEQQINSITFSDSQKEDAKKYRAKNYLYSDKDINTVADIINKGHTPIFLLRCMIDEWTSEPKVLYPSQTSGFNINHYVPAIGFGLLNGKKVIVVQDSWGSSFGANGLRFLDEEFIKSRVSVVGYTIDLSTEEQTTSNKPIHEFQAPINFGQRGTAVAKLQEILRYEGFFPADPTIKLGYFGSITAQALIKWQLKHGINDFKDIKDLKMVRVGLKTLAKLNELYAK